MQKRYIEEMLTTLQTPYRDRSTSGNSGKDDQLFPRRDLSPGESPPSFLKGSPPKQRGGGGGGGGAAENSKSAVSRRISSPTSGGGGGGGLQREQTSDAIVAPVDRPKARRRMQSTDALLGGRSSFSPTPLSQLEPVSVSDDDTSGEQAKRLVNTRERRRRARTVDSAQWAELKSPTRKSGVASAMASQERQPSDGAPAEEPSGSGASEKQRPDGGESPMHRSQARATLATTPKETALARRASLTRTTSDPRRKSGASSDSESGPALRKNNNQSSSSSSSAGNRLSSPVGSGGIQPVFQSTPIRPPGVRPASDVQASSGEDDVLSGHRSPVGGQKENAQGKVMSPTKSENGMDNSGWYEYGCV